jgi:Family of unknown function (DUF5994)
MRFNPPDRRTLGNRRPGSLRAREVVAVMAKTVNKPHGRTEPARLDFRLDHSTPTVLDGAWWPRSRDAVAELVDLVSALDSQHARITLIMLNPHGWHDRPRRIQATGRSVQVAWIDDLDPAVLIASTSLGRIGLLVQFDDEREVSATGQ